MPEMGGLEATAAIRERERGDRRPRPHRGDDRARDGRRPRAMPGAGMDAYVSKPLRPDELLAAIDSLFASITPHRTPAPHSGTRLRRRTPPSTARWTARRLLACFGGNRKLLGEVIDVFLADSPALMAAIRQAADSATDGAGLGGPRAQGIGRAVRAAGRYQTARRLERAATSGDLTGVQEACARLEREMASLRVTLGNLRKRLRRRAGLKTGPYRTPR